MIEKMDSKLLLLATASILGQAPRRGRAVVWSERGSLDCVAIVPHRFTKRSR